MIPGDPVVFYITAVVFAFFIVTLSCYFFWVLLFVRYIYRPRSGIVPRIFCCMLLLIDYCCSTEFCCCTIIIVHTLWVHGVGCFFPAVCCAVLKLDQVLRTAVVVGTTGTTY